MYWEAIATITGIISATGVILSLIYLARQIKSQNRESRISSIHDLNESFRNSITSFQNPNLADVFVRAKDNFESLSETERLQFISMIQGVFRVWEDAFYQYQEKRLPHGMWKAMVVQYSGYLGLSGVKKVWSIRKMAYSEEFRNFVDATTPIDYLSK